MTLSSSEEAMAKASTILLAAGLISVSALGSQPPNTLPLRFA